MARAGVPLTDVMIFGRWASLSSFKLYIAKGDVLLTRLRQDLADEKWSAIERLATLILVALRHFDVLALSTAQCVQFCGLNRVFLFG